MVFLNPAVLLGLLAAAIPVLLHFLNLQKLKRIEFSTLAFLKELQKTKIRKLRFKQWLLLALRVLLILLLVSAFARPTLETFSISGTSVAKTSSVFIIDDSFSMSVVKGNGSYFNNAKEIIKNILKDFQQGDEAAIIFTTEKDKPKFLSSVSDIDRSLSLKDVTVKQQSVAEAISNAKELLEKSNNFNKELFILSDFAKNDFREDQKNLNFQFDANTKIYLFDFSENDLSNRSVMDLKLDNQLIEPGKSISFTAQIQNTSATKVSNSVVSLFINGTRSAQQSFDLDEYESKSVNFETTLNGSGLVEAYVELEQDDIQQDNLRYAAVFVPEKINILLASDNKEDIRFLKLALQSSSERQTTFVKEISNADLSYNLSSTYDVIVIVGSKGIKNVVELNNYIDEGGRVIIFPGSLSEVNDFQQLLSGIGLRKSIQRIGNINSTESIAYFGSVEYKHPIFSNLFEDKDDTKVESPELYTYFKIEPSEQLLPIISLTDNSLFLSEMKRGKGRILLFNSAPILSWGSFPVKTLFAPLINKSVIYQTMKNETGENIIAGNTLDIEVDKLKFPQIKIVKPDATEDFVNVDQSESANFFKYDRLDQIGVYKFYSGEELIDFASVNFDPAESNTAYAPEEEIESFIEAIAEKDNYTFIDPNENYNESIKQARFGTELWKYFLIAALLVALIEMFVSKNSKKDFAEIKNKV